MSKPLIVIADMDTAYLAELENKFLVELGDRAELEIISDPEYFEQFFSEHHSEYDIVHLHAPYIAFLCLPVAAKYGIGHRIVHSHATVYAESKGKAVRNRIPC